MSLYDLFDGSLVVEFAADISADVCSDTGGTTPAADGGTVAGWNSSSESSLSTIGVQVSASRKPIYREDYSSSGYPAVEFAGNDDGLVVAHDNALNITSGRTVYAVVTIPSFADFRMIWSKLNNTSWTDGELIFEKSSPAGTNWTAGNYTISSFAKLSTGRQVLAFTTDKTCSAIGVNRGGSGGNIAVSYSANTKGAGIGCAGESGGTIYGFVGAIHHLLVADTAHTPTEQDSIVRLLCDRWGVNVDLEAASSGSSLPLIGGKGLVY